MDADRINSYAKLFPKIIEFFVRGTAYIENESGIFQFFRQPTIKYPEGGRYRRHNTNFNRLSRFFILNDQTRNLQQLFMALR